MAQRREISDLFGNMANKTFGWNHCGLLLDTASLHGLCGAVVRRPISTDYLLLRREISTLNELATIIGRCGVCTCAFVLMLALRCDGGTCRDYLALMRDGAFAWILARSDVKSFFGRRGWVQVFTANK